MKTYVIKTYVTFIYLLFNKLMNWAATIFFSIGRLFLKIPVPIAVFLTANAVDLLAA